jgi:hypothetical protein
MNDINIKFIGDTSSLIDCSCSLRSNLYPENNFFGKTCFISISVNELIMWFGEKLSSRYPVSNFTDS